MIADPWLDMNVAQKAYAEDPKNPEINVFSIYNRFMPNCILRLNKILNH